MLCFLSCFLKFGLVNRTNMCTTVVVADKQLQEILSHDDISRDISVKEVSSCTLN